jgi:hypothetical protein
MSTFKVGDKVVLDGEGWDVVPRRGAVVTIERLIWQGFEHAVGAVGVFTMGGEEWIVWGEEGHLFHVSVVNEPSQVGMRGRGFLDGSLGLPAAESDDEYLLGYTHGCERSET